MFVCLYAWVDGEGRAARKKLSREDETKKRLGLEWTGARSSDRYAPGEGEEVEEK